MRTTETRLRSIIRSVINEQGQWVGDHDIVSDLSSQSHLDIATNKEENQDNNLLKLFSLYNKECFDGNCEDEDFDSLPEVIDLVEKLGFNNRNYKSEFTDIIIKTYDNEEI